MPSSHTYDANSKKIFWGCFIALVTTSMAFITRAILIGSGVWPEQFGLDKVQASELFGAGIWPFAISIILFSLVIDRIGYRAAMLFSFVCYALYGVFAYMAYAAVSDPALSGEALAAAQGKAWNLLYFGSIILGLGNGTVEAFINPVVATLFPKEKTKWLNILHAGWPGGLVLGGVITIALGSSVADNWLVLVAILVAPAIIYLVMLFKAQFPVNERVAAGASYRQMLAEFGIAGAFIASALIVSQLGQVFGWSGGLRWTLVAILTIGYGAYARSFGRPVMIILVLLMMPLATTEIGTDSWISGLMEEPMGEAGWNPAWVLVYTSAIMMILRFNVGPIVKVLTPLGLLAACCVVAIIGLYLLSFAHGLAFIFFAATLYGIGKTFFWPTMLGVVSEQFPTGGALTLNAIAGIGMLAVGIIGGPLIGKLQETTVAEAIEADHPALYEQVVSKRDYVLGDYSVVDATKVETLPEADQAKIQLAREEKTQSALAKVVVFPVIMLVGYLGLILYYKSQGGYRAQAMGMH